MRRVPAWANIERQKHIRDLKQVAVLAFVVIMILGANLYVNREANKLGEVREPTLLDVVLFRRIVSSDGFEDRKVTLMGTYEIDYH